MKKIIKTKYCISFLLVILGLVGLSPSHATMTFEQWKYQQEKHDLRLKAQHLSSVSNDKIITLSGVLPHQSKDEQGKNQVLGHVVKVNLNTANAQELAAKLERIGLKKAQAIVAYREKNGPFRQVSELKNVKGIGDKTYEINRNRLKLID